MKLSLELRCEHDAWKPLGPLRKLVRTALDAALVTPPVRPQPGAEISLLFTGDAQMRVINKAWREIDKPTNVLSFPAAAPGMIANSPMLGDIVIAYETVEREARSENKTFEDHLVHLVIHGLYHLLGDDHETEENALLMETREAQALKRLGIGDPYHEPSTEAAQAGKS